MAELRGLPVSTLERHWVTVVKVNRRGGWISTDQITGMESVSEYVELGQGSIDFLIGD